jgi:hypothetical protein
MITSGVGNTGRLAVETAVMVLEGLKPTGKDTMSRLLSAYYRVQSTEIEKTQKQIKNKKDKKTRRHEINLEASKINNVVYPYLRPIIEVYCAFFHTRLGVSIKKHQIEREARNLVDSSNALYKYNAAGGNMGKLIKYQASRWFDMAGENLSSPPVVPCLETGVPSAPQFVFGLMRRKIRTLVRRKRISSLAFCRTFAKSKCMWPEVSDPAYLASRIDHSKTFSADSPAINSDAAFVLKSVSEEIFGNLPPPTRVLPTASSSLLSKRKVGGRAANTVGLETGPSHETITLKGEFCDTGHLRWQCSENYTGWTVCCKKHSFLNDPEHLLLSRWRVDPLPYFGQRVIKIPHFLLMYTTTKSWKTRQNTMYEEQITEDSSRAADLSWIGLKEAGQKVRSITLGCHKTYNALLPLQGQLLDCWKNFHPSTMRDEDLTHRVQRMLKYSKELPLAVSVDYKSATDLISRLATLLVLHGIDSPLIKLALKSFGKGRLQYPTIKSILDAVKLEVDSNNGQPMGHVLSFSLLCAINYSALKLATQRYLHKFGFNPESKKLMDKILSTCIINGDDLCFRSPNFYFIDIFYGCAREFGLQPSAGKQFVSRLYCTINSQDFLLTGSIAKRAYYYRTTWTQKNLSLFELNQYINTMAEELPWTTPLIPRILSRTPTVRCRAFPGFVPNWFLPLHLGGAGINPKFARGRVKYTRSQRLVAAHFFTNPDVSIQETTAKHAKGFPSKLRFRLGKSRIALRQPGDFFKTETTREDFIINDYEVRTTYKSLRDGSSNEQYLQRAHDLNRECWSTESEGKPPRLKRLRWIHTMSNAQLSEVLRGVLVTSKCPVVPCINPTVDITSFSQDFITEPLDGVSLEAFVKGHELDQKGAHKAYVLNTSLLNLYGSGTRQLRSYLPPSQLCDWDDIKPAITERSLFLNLEDVHSGPPLLY